MDEIDQQKYPPRWLAVKRQTGRTTRMLKAVEKACQPGARIIVVAPNDVSAMHMQRQFEHALPKLDGKPTYQSERGQTRLDGAQVSWRSCRSPAWDWYRLRFTGTPAVHEHFVDPACIEDHFAHVLDLWHRFDQD